jgi:endonuclease YncB( thermonuclease family)
MRYIVLLFGLSALISAAWLLEEKTQPRETIVADQYEIVTADGDSFRIGNRKLRLKGIDAPELHQTCNDATGAIWSCGQSAHGALITLLAEPGLSCVAEISDRFGRSLATCKTSKTPDIGAAQVAAGMAMSDEFNGLQTYGDEEEQASSAKRGIWRGEFMPPKEWRAAHKRGTPTES